MLQIALSNDFSFEIESVSEIYEGHTNNSSLTIIHEITEKNASEVQKEIKTENLSPIILKVDGDQLDRFEGFTEIVTIEKIITNYERMLTIRLKTVEQKPTK